MTPVQPNGPFPIAGATMPTWMVRFDENGQCISPATARALIEHLKGTAYSDILFFAHGWNTDFSGAVGQYGDFLKAFAQVLATHPIPGFNPIFVGIAWPSIWLAEDAGAAPASIAADVQNQVVVAAAAPLSPTDRDRLYELTDAPTLSFEEARELAALLLPSIGNEPDEVGDDAAIVADADALVAAAAMLSASHGGPPASLTIIDASPIMPPALTLGGDGGFDPRDILRMFSLFQMKDRAGKVGANGVAALLRQLQQANSARLRLIGHSFGCKVMLSAVCAPARLVPPVASMLLMQPAISHLSMAKIVPGRTGSGGYRTALERVDGQIFSTFSAKDMPLHDIFHLALRRKADLGDLMIRSVEAGEPPSKYAAMGGYGPRGADEKLIEPIPAPGEDFGDLTGIKLVALDGSADRINGHGDVATGFTAWALRRLIAGAAHPPGTQLQEDDGMTLDEIRAEIASIEIPEDIGILAGAAAADLPAVPDYKADVPQVITVGSQIAEFSKGVPPQLRETIANCILLAQLASDRWVETHTVGELTWYNCYLATMKKCGWLVERDETSLRTVAGNGAEVHSEIVNVLTKLLGPAASAASIVLNVVKGVAAMQEGQPFFTIFNRASQRAEAQLFQISYVDAGADKAPRLSFACYRVEASASATQILFFKLAVTDARLRSSNADLSIDESMLKQVKDLIFQKVATRIAGNITEIEI